MKILIMAGYFYPTIGGAQKSIMSLVKACQAKGSEVIVVTRLEDGMKPFEIYIGIPIYRIKFSVIYLRLRTFITTVIILMRGLFRLLKITYDFKPDLINVAFLSENAILASLLTYFYKCRLVVSIHGHDGILYKANNINRLLYQRLLNKSEIIIFNSEAMHIKFKQEVGYHLDGNKLRIIPNMIDLEEFDKTKERFILANNKRYIFGCGNFIFGKGFDILIRGFGLICKEYPDVDLVIAGDGPERNNLESLVSSQAISERVHFMGFIDPNEVGRYFLGCMFFVIPSRFESFGNVILEAMAARKAVIGAKTGGIPILVKDDLNGYLFENEDYQMLAKKMKLLIEDKNKRERLGLSARQFVQENYSHDFMPGFDLKIT